MSSARGRIPRAINHKGINTALLLDKLKPMLGALDDSAWEALASRGLLRRAQKDIERKAAVSIAGERAGCLAVTVDKYEVLIPETGPSKATCDCPAAGVCQHILMACLFIKQQASALERPDESQHSVAGKLDDQPQAEPGSNKPASDSAGEVTNATGELLKITVGALRKWAGTKTFRAAVSFLSQNENVLIEEQNTVVVRFPLIQVSCQFVPGGGLDGMIVSGPRNQAKKLAVASVLAYQGRHGMETAPEAIAEQTLAELEGAPRTREEVTHAVEQLLEESIVAGLSHLSLSAAERFSTLAVSSLGVNLPRLSLALKSIADEIDLLAARKARADESRLLFTMARTYALAQAIRGSTAKAGTPRSDLVGLHRTRYYDVQSIELSGVAAYPWRTASGYTGLTVLFWEDSGKQWFSWSEARPESRSTGFNPVSSYTAPGPWQGADSPFQISRSRFTLANAKRNGAGRLSSSAKSRAVVLGPIDTGGLNFEGRQFKRWSDLGAHSSRAATLGLKDAAPLDNVVVVTPSSWGTKRFDEGAQTFHWDLVDEEGFIIPIEIPFDEFSKPAIELLESLSPPSVLVVNGDGAAAVPNSQNNKSESSEEWRLVARLVRREGRFSLLPFSIIGKVAAAGTVRSVLNLFLDSMAGVSQNVAAAKFEEPSDANSPGVKPELPPDTEDEGDTVTSLDEPLDEPSEESGTESEYEVSGFFSDSRIREVEEQLTLVAEAGTGALTAENLRSFAAHGEKLNVAGLFVLGAMVLKLGGGNEVASHVLRCCYLCNLYRQAFNSRSAVP